MLIEIFKICKALFLAQFLCLKSGNQSWVGLMLLPAVHKMNSRGRQRPHLLSVVLKNDNISHRISVKLKNKLIIMYGKSFKEITHKQKPSTEREPFRSQ